MKNKTDDPAVFAHLVQFLRHQANVPRPGVEMAAITPPIVSARRNIILLNEKLSASTHSSSRCRGSVSSSFGLLQSQRTRRSLVSGRLCFLSLGKKKEREQSSYQYEIRKSFRAQTFFSFHFFFPVAHQLRSSAKKK